MTLASCSPVHPPKNEKAVIATVFNCDHCKQCETCGQLFHDNMYKMTGVRMYEIDIEKNVITVYYDGSKINLDSIRKGIADLGYDADDVRATQEGFDKLDECCKK
ncbi:MAG TPA: cation transporter [Flavobacterium sp.]|nr:cation transporter [Flavobacterium sp.]